MNDIISQLVDIDTRKRKQAQAEEAKRMKNPIYRLKRNLEKITQLQMMMIYLYKNKILKEQDIN